MRGRQHAGCPVGVERAADPHTRIGMGPRAVGFLFDALMQSLGSGRSIVHGGDQGAHITSLLGSHRPDRVAGIHPTGIAPCDTTAAQLTGEGAEDATEEEKSFVADP